MTSNRADPPVSLPTVIPGTVESEPIVSSLDRAVKKWRRRDSHRTITLWVNKLQQSTSYRFHRSHQKATSRYKTGTAFCNHAFGQPTPQTSGPLAHKPGHRFRAARPTGLFRSVGSDRHNHPAARARSFESLVGSSDLFKRKSLDNLESSPACNKSLVDRASSLCLVSRREVIAA